MTVVAVVRRASVAQNCVHMLSQCQLDVTPISNDIRAPAGAMNVSKGGHYLYICECRLHVQAGTVERFSTESKKFKQGQPTNYWRFHWA